MIDTANPTAVAPAMASSTGAPVPSSPPPAGSLTPAQGSPFTTPSSDPVAFVTPTSDPVAFTTPSTDAPASPAVTSFDATPDDKLVSGPFSPTQFYNDNKSALSPQQYNRLVGIYKSRQESGYTGAGAGNAAVSAVKGLGQTVADAGSTVAEIAKAGMSADTLAKAGAAQLAESLESNGTKGATPATLWDVVKPLLTKEGGEALAGVENMATGMGNLVRTGINSAVNNDIPRSVIQTGANLIGKPELGQPIGTALFGPRENADVLSPSTMAQPTDWSAEFQRDAAVSDQLQKTESANGEVLKSVGLDPDSVAKDGITYNPAAIRTISFASNPLNYVPMLGGLKVANLARGAAITDASGNVIAHAATEGAAQTFVKKAATAAASVVKGTASAAGKTLNVAGNLAGAPSDAAATFFQNALSREGGRGILAGLGKTMDTIGNNVAARGVVGAAKDYLTQPFSLANTVKNFTYGSLDDILGFMAGGHVVGTGLLASGITKAALQGAAKGISAAGETGANAITSDTANALIRGAGTGAAFQAPLAAAQTDPNDQMQSLFTGSMFGAGGTAFGLGLGKSGVMARQAGIRGAQILNSHIFQNLDSANVEPVTLNVPGLENLESQTQQNVQSLKGSQTASQFNLLRALLNPDAATGQTSTPQGPRQPIYLLTPEQMVKVDPQLAGADGVSNAQINGQNVTLVALKNGKVPALSHEVAHSFVNYFQQSDPQGFQAAVNSISPAVREQFKNAYLSRSGVDALSPQATANMETPDYQNRELMSEVFSRYLTGEALNLPATVMQSVGTTVGNLLGSLGVDGSHMTQPGSPGASESMGLVPGFQAQKIARGAIKKMLADPAIQGAMKAVKVPPRLNAPAAATPVAPAMPAAPQNLVTPAHQAVIDALKTWHPALGAQYQAVLGKVQRGETLTPTEARQWKDIQTNAGQPPAPVPAQPAPPVTPAAPAPPAPESVPAPTPATPPAPAPESIRNTPADFQRFTGASRQPAQERVKQVSDAVANSTSLTPEQKTAATQLLGNLRTPHDVVYNAAKDESGTGRSGRRADIEAARRNPDLRAAASKLASIPLDARLLKNGDAQIQMWSGDKVLSNVEEAVNRITAVGQEKAIPYEVKNGKLTEAGMSELASDLQKYAANQDNGFRGDGKDLSRPTNPKGFIPDENPGYTPQPVSAQRADFLNMLMGEAPPKTARVNEGVVPIQARAKELATKNAHSGEVIQPAKKYKEPYSDVSISDYNPLRARLNKAGVDLSNLTEAHEWVNAKDLKSATPRPDIRLNPTATDVTAAGFLPRQDERAVVGAAVQDDRGQIYGGSYHGDAIDRARAAGAKPIPGYSDPSWDVPFKVGFVTHGGEFLSRDEAFKRGVELGQIPPDVAEVDQDGVHTRAFKNAGAFMPSDEDLKAIGADKGYTYDGRFGLAGGSKALWQFTYRNLPKTDAAYGASFYTPEGSDLAHIQSRAAEVASRFRGVPPKVEEARFMPNDEVRKIAAGYMESAKLPYTPHTGYEPVNEVRAKRIADFYQGAPHEPANPAVRKSYNAFVNETKAQWDYITSHGVKMEPWTKQGQPYKNSAEMMADVGDNHHLFYFPTENGYGQVAKEGDLSVPTHPLLAKSGVLVNGKDVPVNDLFRAVHDYFGHSKEGYEFGPRGEYNAYLAHSRMYSEAARPAMAAETLGQNSWVNFGEHLRNAKGSIPKKGEAGYVHPADRPFAEQKATVLPSGLSNAEPHFMPATDPDKEHILQAAIKLPDGKIFSGSAHFFAQNNAESAGASERDIVNSDEGFLTNTGRFVNREEAFRIGVKNGQIPPDMAYMEPGTGPGDLRPAWHEDFGFEGKPQLESVAFNRVKRFMPVGGRDSIRPATHEVNPDETDYSKYDIQPRVNKPGKLTGWVLPNGKVKPLETSLHEDDLSHNHEEYNKKFGTSFTSQASDSDRVPALNAGFVRIRNYNGNTTIEANARSWAKQRAIVEQHLLNHSDAIDKLTINLLDDKGDEVNSAHAKLFDAPNPEQKIQQTVASVEAPAITKETAPSERGPGLIQRARAIPGPAELSRSGFMPTQEDLFGGTKPQETDVRKMSPAALTKQFPEIVKPTLTESGEKTKIPYDFADAPLVKKLKTEDEKVSAYSDALANEARKWEPSPEFQSGLRWYSEFVPKLQKWFGKHTQLFAELLAATSPRTNPTVNFGYAAKAFEGWVRGEYDGQISKYNEGLSKLKDGSLSDWYNKNVPESARQDKPSESNMMGAWVAAHKLVPTQWGRATEFGDPKEVKFGMHGERILQVLTRNWMNSNQGPKVRQFVGNLTGKSNGATIDVWASRTLRRLGYDAGGKRWRILPEQESGVSDADFAFGQKVFAAAAAKLGITPDALQGGMWFAEKRHWANKGWQRLDLGDFRNELENFISRRKLRAAQMGLGDDIIPLNQVQYRGSTVAPGDIKPVSGKAMELFDIKPKK